MPIKPIRKDGMVAGYEVTVSENIGRKRFQKKRRYNCSLPEARKRELDLLDEVRRDAKEVGVPTFWDWIERWLETAALTRKKSTVDAYRSTLNTHVPHDLCQKPITRISTSDIQGIVFNQKAEITPKTRENLLQCLKVILKHAMYDHLIPFNPADGVKISVPETKLQAWTIKEINQFLEEASRRRHPWYPIWVTAVLSGMRSGELYALEWVNVDFENRRIYVVANWTLKDGLHETKNRRNRVVPMNSQLFKFLAELKLKRGSEKNVLPHFDEWTKGMQAAVLRRFAKQIGLRQINFHALRASFITICMLQSVSTVKVQAIVGHQRLDTTMRYIRIIGADLDDATENIGINIPIPSQTGNVVLFAPRQG
ncbi:MAG: tyrosine-type recombinase/integrase [Bacteriovoracia bacterium]